MKQNGERLNDKISEVISHFAGVQSNSVDLEGSCQSMVYRSVMDKKNIITILFLMIEQTTKILNIFLIIYRSTISVDGKLPSSSRWVCSE